MRSARSREPAAARRSGERKLLGLAEETKRVGVSHGSVNVVGERQDSGRLSEHWPLPDLPPCIVKLRTIVHQVHAVLKRDPDCGLEKVFQAFFVF